MKSSQFVKAVLILGILLGGCMMPPQVHPPLGDSVRETMARQVANPAAGDELDPGTGLDGVAGETVLETYREGFKPKKDTGTSLITINQ